MASLVGPQEHFLQMVFIDVCYSAHERSDMAAMVGMFSDWNQFWHKNIYLGWTAATVENSTSIKAA